MSMKTKDRLWGPSWVTLSSGQGKPETMAAFRALWVATQAQGWEVAPLRLQSPHPLPGIFGHFLPEYKVITVPACDMGTIQSLQNPCNSSESGAPRPWHLKSHTGTFSQEASLLLCMCGFHAFSL